MRGANVLLAVIVTVALCLGCGELLAKAQSPAIVTSMSAHPDSAQLQSAIWEWLRETTTSAPFFVGIAAGIAIAETCRFTIRWLMRAVGFVGDSVRVVVRYRLLAVAVASLLYYVTAFHLLA
jgi:hypothetical protein